MQAPGGLRQASAKLQYAHPSRSFIRNNAPKRRSVLPSSAIRPLHDPPYERPCDSLRTSCLMRARRNTAPARWLRLIGDASASTIRMQKRTRFGQCRAPQASQGRPWSALHRRMHRRTHPSSELPPLQLTGAPQPIELACCTCQCPVAALQRPAKTDVPRSDQTDTVVLCSGVERSGVLPLLHRNGLRPHVLTCGRGVCATAGARRLDVCYLPHTDCGCIARCYV
jgi:hypothetical protein